MRDNDDDDDERRKLFHHHHHHHLLFTSSSDMPLNPPQQSWLPRRSSVSSPSPSSQSPRLKGKDRSLDGLDPNPSNFGYDKPSEPSDHSRHRSSLLSVASDALGLRKKIGSVSRRKQNLSHLANTLSEVIEINASNDTTVTTIGGTTALRDFEYEERERLRDAAAQSIGLGPDLLLHDSCMTESRSSLASLHSPQSSSLSARIPSFPSTSAALRPFTELSSALPKFTPPSSLLIYALAKQWKSRVIMLTSHSSSQKTHLHLFKGASRDEREIERLEVTENSVIFVAEEEVGGRRNVVKLAGKDVSGKRCGSGGEDSLLTMWYLQIIDPAESQRWIAAIKNAVLTQRAVRVGVDIPARTNGRNEPKGDIDVMLSMHLQGLLSTKPSSPVSFSPPHIRASPSPPPSLRSLKMNVPLSPSPTVAVKGFFSGSRPRSPSVDGSPTSAFPLTHPEDSFGVAGSSLLTMLRSKSSADSTSSPSQSLPLPLPHVSGQCSPAPSLRSANAPVIISASELKISKERDTPELSTTFSEVRPSSTPPVPNTPPTPPLSVHGAATLSLQPPPRRSKHMFATVSATSPHERQGMYKQPGGNRSVAGNFGISSGVSSDATPREASPVSPSSSNFSGGLSWPFSPNPEMQSLYADEAYAGQQQQDDVADNEMINSLSPLRSSSVPSDRLMQGTAIKRWSRQGIPLPKQLSPPSGPPPSIPSSSEPVQRSSLESSISMPATYVTDRSPNSSASISYSQAQSISSLSPKFRKRTSGSSTYSTTSLSTSDSRGRTQTLTSSGGEPFFSSLGSIPSKGTSSRPLSLLVPVSMPMGQIGALKRRSMPPPRPAPTFAPPPAPVTVSGPVPLMSTPRKSFRSSIAQRALRLSLTAPKPPPSFALPPRPDEVGVASVHRRSSSASTQDVYSISAPSSRPSSVLSNSVESVSPPPRSLSLRQRLRIRSTPPASPSPIHSPSFLSPSIQVSTLDLSDDNDDDLPTPCLQNPYTFGLGEHIMAMQNEPSFLQLSTPVTPTAPKPLPRNASLQMPRCANDLRTWSFEPDRDFVALSPPPPRRGSRPHVVAVKRSEKLEEEISDSVQHEDALVKLSQQGSVISLGFVTS